MPRSFFVTPLHLVLDALTVMSRRKDYRPQKRHSPGVESLEGRALMANITASGLISSTPVGSNFDYTITMTNSSSSTSAIGTFWYAWIPEQNYLATSPIAVTAPAGWSDQITHSGKSDGYGILFTANSSMYYVQPGSSMNFSFESADTPTQVNGDSVFYPGVPVSTSFVYPQAPFSDGGHEFVVTPNQTPLVTVANVRNVQNKRHRVTQIDIEFSGPVNAADAESETNYLLVMPGKKGSFSAKNARVIKLKSPVYVATLDEVTLTPEKPFALTKPVQLTVEGSTAAGLHDSAGRLIDGGHTGHAGSNAVVVLSHRGVSA